MVSSRQVAPTAIGATISGRVWMVRKKPLSRETRA